MTTRTAEAQGRSARGKTIKSLRRTVERIESRKDDSKPINYSQRMLVVNIVDQLRNRMSGPSSEGSEYTFREPSSDSCFLSDIDSKLRNKGSEISGKEMKRVLAIGKRYNIEPTQQDIRA